LLTLFLQDFNSGVDCSLNRSDELSYVRYIMAEHYKTASNSFIITRRKYKFTYQNHKHQ